MPKRSGRECVCISQHRTMQKIIIKMITCKHVECIKTCCDTRNTFKAERCTVFDSLRTSVPGPGTAYPICLPFQINSCVYRPLRQNLSEFSPVQAEDAISQETYLTREGKCCHFCAKELLKFEAGLVSIPTQHVFCC